MNTVQTHPSVMAEWQVLVNDAISQCGYQVDDQLRHYLMITLNQFTTDQQIASVIIAFDFLRGLEAFGRQGSFLLRQVGDRCLILAGLFPEQASKRLITVEYFVNVGQQAYETLATVRTQAAYDSELFHKLSLEFIHLINILHTMRELSPTTKH